MTTEFGLLVPLPLVLVGPLAVILFGAVGWLIGRIVFRIISSGIRRTQTPIDDIVLNVLKAPISSAGALVAIWLALRGLPLSSETVRYVNRGWVIVATLLLVSIGLRSLNGFTRGVVEKTPNLAPAAGMIRVIGRVIVLSLGGVMLLQSFGIAVEPLIASMGIGSLAVALALRDTLSNFFAGLYIHADRPLRVGNYVKIENGEEGYVQQIGWRSTRIKNLSNNIDVVPNEKLAQSILTNFDLPDSTFSFSIPVPVGHGIHPDRILKQLNEIALGLPTEIPELIPDAPPSVSFGGFGETGSLFSLNCRVRSHVDQGGVRSTIQLRILERFLREGIPFPSSGRVVLAPTIEEIMAGKSNGAAAAGE
jgi:small-conductance mechanosensitive channel